MLEESDPSEAATVALVASGPQALVPAVKPVPSAPARRRRPAWMLWTAASAAVIALLAVIVTMMGRPAGETAATAKPIALASDGVLPTEAALKPSDPQVVPAVQTHTAERPRVAKARTTGKRATAVPARKPASKPNFFKRQLLRVVIK